MHITRTTKIETKKKENTTKKKMKREENNGLLIATSPTAKHLQIAFIPIYKMQNHSIKFIQTVRCAAKRVRCIRFVCPLDCETRWIQPKTPNSSKLKMTAKHKMNRNDCLNSDECVCVRASVCICQRCAFKTLCNGLKSGHITYVCVCVCLCFVMEIFSRFAYYCLPLNIQNVQFKNRSL